MKYRKSGAFRVLYDLSGRRQEEIIQYQAFMEEAQENGWEVITISDQIESQIRHLCELGKVDAVVGNFISETWLDSLPSKVKRIHMGMNPLGSSTSCVVWDLCEAGRMIKEHCKQEGYEICLVFSPQDQPHLLKGCGATQQLRTLESLREAVENLQSAFIVCPTDYVARVALKGIRVLEKAVPEDLGVVGIGGRSLDAVLSELKLTSVALPYAEKGRRIAQALGRELEKSTPKTYWVKPIRVVQGETTQKKSTGLFLPHDLENWVSSLLADPPPVEEWARRAGMSRRGYERAFAQQAGCTPYEYLLRLREKEAKRLLKETSLSLSRIGEQIGIPEPPRFSAFFKKRTGVPASVWRVEG